MLLFQKQKSVSYEQEDTIVKISYHYKDNFHELTTTLSIDSEAMVIIAADAKMQAAPWDLCYEILTKMEDLVGLKIQKGAKKQVQEILGGSCGCIHLVALTTDSITTFVQLIDYYNMPKELPYKEKMKRISEINKGICHTYNNMDRNPKLLNENLQSQID